MRLSDCGVAHYFGSSKECTLKLPRGKETYMSTECLAEGSYDACSSDVYSLGIFLVVVLVGAYPVEKTLEHDLNYIV